MNLEKLKQTPEEFYVFIEIPKHSRNKYEYNEELGILVLDRVLFTAYVYPCDYGFIPNTLSPDGDPIDCMVLTTEPGTPGTLVKARPIGVLIGYDEKGRDDKILAVPVENVDMRFSNIRDIKDVPAATLRELQHFWEHMKELEPGKWFRIEGLDGVTAAKKLVEEGIKNWTSSKGFRAT
ncbi:MAG: inorganic diphosphatase [Candidatus Korarchaeota archaeon]